jgi:hypothetical protein
MFLEIGTRIESIADSVNVSQSQSTWRSTQPHQPWFEQLHTGISIGAVPVMDFIAFVAYFSARRPHQEAL